MRKAYWLTIILMSLLLLLVIGAYRPLIVTGSIVGAQTDGIRFSPPKEVPQLTNNTPLHSAVLAGVPINVVVDFNYDRGTGSKIAIIRDGKDYGVGDTKIDDNKLAIRRDMDPAAPDGVYMVKYTSCQLNGSCDEGAFQFALDRSKAAAFTDLRGQKEVVIDLKNYAFDPRNTLVSKGTKVTWKNGDDDTHFVNTDPHPEHSYYRAMNSKALEKGDTFALTFDKPGIYPYHCSAHTSMTGTLIVS
ncbi:MAG: Halocyanin precursor [Methanocella sp. PtaU1.Bin125]|nr:MAG: Halocyanin precursor [Methanocella sp. PtaU1.Bin125]